VRGSVMEHFPLIDVGESELVRGSRSGQGPHKVKSSYPRILALLLVLLLLRSFRASSYHLSLSHSFPHAPIPLPLTKCLETDGSEVMRRKKKKISLLRIHIYQSLELNNLSLFKLKKIIINGQVYTM